MINSLNTVLLRTISNDHRNHRHLCLKESRVHNKFMIVETQGILFRMVIWSNLHRNMQQFLNERNRVLRPYLNIMSVDVALGLPFNIASYGLLLLLLCEETGLEPGKLVGFLADTHIYENHIDGLMEQMNRDIKPLTHLHINNFKSIFEWDNESTTTSQHVYKYVHHPAIKFKIAV